LLIGCKDREFAPGLSPGKLEFQTYPNKIIDRRLRKVPIRDTFLPFMDVAVYPGVGLIFHAEDVIKLEVEVDLLNEISR